MAHKKTKTFDKSSKISDSILDDLLIDCKNPEDLLREDGLLKLLKKRVVERMLQGELTHHLGYEKHSVVGNKSGNSRNGLDVQKTHSEVMKEN